MTQASPRRWMQAFCSPLGEAFLFLDPVSWQTHLLSAGAVRVLSESAQAIEEGRFDVFLAEVADLGGWPPGLEDLARSLQAFERSMLLPEREWREAHEWQS